MAAYIFEHITFGYTDQLLYDDASLRLYAGQLHFLVGESGAGKSTLLKLLAKRLPCSTLTCSAPEWHLLDTDEIAEQLIGYQLIDHGYMDQLTVRQNLREAEIAYHSSDIKDELIQLFSFEKHLHKYPHQLSGGQRRILSVILTLMKDLPLIFLDEPTASLDHETKDKFLNYLKDYALSGHTVLLATNDNEVTAHAKHILTVEHEKIYQNDSDEKKECYLPAKTDNHRYRFRTMLYHQPWQKLVFITVAVLVSVFLGQSLMVASREIFNAAKSLASYAQVYENTAHVYYTVNHSQSYLGINRAVTEDLQAYLMENENVINVYPHYDISLGSPLMLGKAENKEDSNRFCFSSENVPVINLYDQPDAYISFYYPEQLEGTKIYISEVFLFLNQLSFEDVRDIYVDAAVPVAAQEDVSIETYTDNNGQVTEISFPAFLYTYRRTNCRFQIDDTHDRYNSLYFSSMIPLIYMPYAAIENYVDSNLISANVFDLILKEDADIEALRNDIYRYNDALILSYPPQLNQSTIAYIEHAVTRTIVQYIECIGICLFAVTCLFILLELFYKNDYLYLRYSGMSKKAYIKARILAVLLVLSGISLSSVVYAIIAQQLYFSWLISLAGSAGFIMVSLLLYGLFLGLRYKQL